MLFEALSAGTTTNFWWMLSRLLVTTGSSKTDLFLVPIILGKMEIFLSTNVLIALTHSDKVSVSTFSLLAHFLACSSTASMICMKLPVHVNERGSRNFGPLDNIDLNLGLSIKLRSPGLYYSRNNNECLQPSAKMRCRALYPHKRTNTFHGDKQVV